MDGDHRIGWTRNMVVWNTLGTVLGALSGWAAVIVLIYLEVVK